MPPQGISKLILRSLIRLYFIVMSNPIQTSQRKCVMRKIFSHIYYSLYNSATIKLPQLQTKIRVMSIERDYQLMRTRFYALLWFLTSRKRKQAEAILENIDETAVEISRKTAFIQMTYEAVEFVKVSTNYRYNDTCELLEELFNVYQEQVPVVAVVLQLQNRINEIERNMALQQDTVMSYEHGHLLKNIAIRETKSEADQMVKELENGVQILAKTQKRHDDLKQQLESDQNNIEDTKLKPKHMKNSLYKILNKNEDLLKENTKMKTALEEK